MNLTFKIFIPVFVTAMMLAVFLPLNVVLNFFHDDSFFYIKTAENVVAGFGSTFDTVNVTNGYHPLWFGILTMYFFFTGIFITPSPESLVRAVFLLNVLITSGIFFVNYRLLSKLFQGSKQRKVFLLLMLILVIPVLIRDFGVESQLAVLIISVYILLKCYGRSSVVWSAILISLIFLVRTDYLYSIIPAMLITEYFTILKSDRRQSMAIILVMLVVVVAGYYAYNFFVFGHLVPVSAAISNAFPENVINKNLAKLFYSYHNMFNITARFGLVVLSFIAAVVMYRRNFYDRNFLLTLVMLNAGAVLFCVIHLVFNNYGLREWYITMPNYIACLTVVLFYAVSMRFYRGVVTVMLLISLGGFYYLRIDSNKFESAYEYAVQLKSNTNERDRIFQTDFSGAVGLFSERNVINGDGFINSYEYRQYVLDGRLDDYFRDKKITYYSTYTFNKPDQRGEVFRDFIAGIYIANYEAVIPRSNEVLMLPYRFRHGFSEYYGFWYLFRVEGEFGIRVIGERPS